MVDRDLLLRVPATYSEAFDVLGEAGLLDAARRDVMIRRYWGQDPEAEQAIG